MASPVYHDYDVHHEDEPIYWNPQNLNVTYRGKTYTRIFDDFGPDSELDKVALKERIGRYKPATFTLYDPNTANENMFLRFYILRSNLEGFYPVAFVWRP